ncbi:MAG: alanine--tRNA ligase [Patescibacteria group bacterium]|jgi:alanyl-tRNA synthetase
MHSKEIREKYLKFFEARKHAVIPSFSIMPENDSSTLFTSAGMQPLVSYLMGEKHPAGARLVNCQKSFRAEDIDEVGDNRHTTFFEMLGNWSLGDYFKREQLPWIYEFLIDELGLDINRLYATVFRGSEEIGVPKDTDSVAFLKEFFSSRGIDAKDVDFSEDKGMQGGRIFYYSAKKNWWSRSGAPEKMPVGEIGGPDSEIFYDLGADLKKHENSIYKDKPCHVNCDCGRFIEIGNSVFIEYKRTEAGFEKLEQQNVDFGGGLERITMVCQKLDNIFETDLFINIIKKIEELSGKKYHDNFRPFEIITDHMRAATFIMGDNKGISPSNTGQGYLVRRLIRRAAIYGKKLGISDSVWTHNIAEIIIKEYGDIYPELKRNSNFVLDQLKKEEEKFNSTLEKGLKEFEKLPEITGQNAFNLYQSFGFPIEMTKELAAEKGLSVDMDSFNQELAKHQELSRTASAGMFKGGLADSGEQTTKLHTAAHLMLAALRQVLGDHVFQKGSNITAERLRFDFSHPQKMTSEEIKKVEEIVNQKIKENLPVICEEMTLDEAKEKGAMGVFESKYGEKVKVYSIGDFSKEICGGPHAKNTQELGSFKIIKEEASSAGVRRIKAVIG